MDFSGNRSRFDVEIESLVLPGEVGRFHVSLYVGRGQMRCPRLQDVPGTFYVFKLVVSRRHVRLGVIAVRNNENRPHHVLVQVAAQDDGAGAGEVDTLSGACSHGPEVKLVVQRLGIDIVDFHVLVDERHCGPNWNY